MNNNLSLWGEGFDVSNKEKDKTLISKLNKPKDVVHIDIGKQLKSKKTSLEDRLSIIKSEVNRVLGHYKNETLVIKSFEDFNSYIDIAIENGIISIDTETNNSLDPITCKLMGPCIYTPNLKQAYIPLNHIDNLTGERLPWQLNEEDCRLQFQRLIDNNIKIVMHNGKFDYKVIHATCNIDLPIYWDTYVAARMLDENEPSAGLKQQYIDKINPEQEKYDIENLFANVEYAQVDPDIFALYAATDAKMTYQLYEWQVEKFKNPDLKNILDLFLNIEMPILPVIAHMELTGVSLDFEYCKRLKTKYDRLLSEADIKAKGELEKYTDKIASWRLTKEANFKPTKKSGNGEGKSKNEQLANPVNLDSPTQLAILLYDILKCPQVSIKMPRGTGVDELKALYEKTNLELCKLILNKRTLMKLMNTFIDKIPEYANEKDNKIHAEFFNVATDTHRFSCVRPNLQQLPRDQKDIRIMFCATPESEEEIRVNHFLNLYNQDKVETNRGWIKAKDLSIGDNIKGSVIKNIERNGTQIRLEVTEDV